jgi:hypothetical protein
MLGMSSIFGEPFLSPLGKGLMPNCCPRVYGSNLSFSQPAQLRRSLDSATWSGVTWIDVRSVSVVSAGTETGPNRHPHVTR